MSEVNPRIVIHPGQNPFAKEAALRSPWPQYDPGLVSDVQDTAEEGGAVQDTPEQERFGAHGMVVRYYPAPADEPSRPEAPRQVSKTATETLREERARKQATALLHVLQESKGLAPHEPLDIVLPHAHAMRAHTGHTIGDSPVLDIPVVGNALFGLANRDNSTIARALRLAGARSLMPAIHLALSRMGRTASFDISGVLWDAIDGDDKLIRGLPAFRLSEPSALPAPSRTESLTMSIRKIPGDTGILRIRL